MIQINFHLPASRIDRLVSFFGRTRFCHVSISYQIAGQWWGAESLATTGVHVFKLNGKPKADAVAYSPIFPTMAEAWLSRRAGEPYGFLDSLAAGIRKWTGVRIGGNPRGMMCAELAAKMMEELIAYEIEDTAITPDELAKRMGVML